MSARQVSAKGRAYTALQEGTPTTAYLDPIGVPTVWAGLTNRNPIVTRELGKIVPGKTKVSPAEGDRIFALVLAEDVEPAVRRGMPGAKQHEFDAAADGSYNLGATRFMGWHWAQLWRAGKKAAAWDHLENNYNTAGGRKLPGLVRRRKENAQIGRTGFYPGIDDRRPAAGQARAATPVPAPAPDPVVEEAQKILTAKGFNPGAIDGWMGKQTSAAVLAYQQAHPHLVNDGILGPATISQLRRDASAVGLIARETVTKALPSAGGAGVLASFAGLPWQIIIPAVLVVALVWFVWTQRDVFTRWINTARGKVVDV